MATAVLAVGAWGAAEAQPVADSAALARRVLGRYDQELRITDLMAVMERRHRAGPSVFRHVTVVDVARGATIPDARVEVGDGRIATIRPDPGGQLRQGEIDGAGRFLAPGLTDMHVHQSASASQHLLEVAAGVTTVRDMAGFPWSLRWREKTAADRWLAPSMIVTGSLLNEEPIGRWASVVRTEAEIRATVRAQADSGYDAIKVYSRLSPELYAAATDEARRVGIPVVGHVPSGTSVERAVASGHRTIEHFTGFSDALPPFAIATDDWLTPIRGGAAWWTPTLYSSGRIGLSGADADTWFAGPEAPYVPEQLRRTWKQDAAAPTPWRADMLDRQRRILAALVANTDRILAGTDAGGGLPFGVPGIGLIEEIRLLHAAGLSRAGALRAATTNPAEATGRQGEFGAIVAGARADLVLLERNPLDDLETLRRPLGVMLRGRWLDRSALDQILDEVRTIAASTSPVAADPAALDQAWVDRLVERVRAVEAGGYVLPDHHLFEISAALRQLRFRAAAAAIASLRAS